MCACVIVYGSPMFTYGYFMRLIMVDSGPLIKFQFIIVNVLSAGYLSSM